MDKSLQDNFDVLINIAKKYQLTDIEFNELWQIIEPIFIHGEFQKRMSSNYPHHDTINLGEHILSDAVVTYITSKKINNKDYNRKTAVLIALFHDLYTYRWQNNPDNIKDYFFNKHLFTHPIEAVINSYTWYPEVYEDHKEAVKIIDGVVHHMFPAPVRSLDGSDIDLNNQNLFNDLPPFIKEKLITSSIRNKIGKISFAPSLFQEGRIMSSSDKKVSWSKDISINGLIVCVTANNKKLKK